MKRKPALRRPAAVETPIEASAEPHEEAAATPVPKLKPKPKMKSAPEGAPAPAAKPKPAGKVLPRKRPAAASAEVKAEKIPKVGPISYYKNNNSWGIKYDGREPLRVNFLVVGFNF